MKCMFVRMTPNYPSTNKECQERMYTLCVFSSNCLKASKSKTNGPLHLHSTDSLFWLFTLNLFYREGEHVQRMYLRYQHSL